MILASFVIKGDLTDLNTYIRLNRGNKFAGAANKHNETKQIIQLIKSQCKDSKIPGEFKLHIRWFMKDARKDPDNVSFGKKVILDAMQGAGLIKNDSFKQVKGFSDEFYIDKEDPRIEVILL